MAYQPPVLWYDDIVERAEDFLAEFHADETLPIPVEQIIELKSDWDRPKKKGSSILS